MQRYGKIGNCLSIDLMAVVIFSSFHHLFRVRVVYDNGCTNGIIALAYVHLPCRIVRCSFRAVNVPQFPFVDFPTYASLKLGT